MPRTPHPLPSPHIPHQPPPHALPQPRPLAGTRQERAHKALIEIGGAVWNGAITTFLAVVTMSAAEHYIFTTIFQMFSVLILLAVWHGLVLLPVLLSWMGPASYREVDGERPSSMTPVEKV